MKKNIIYIFVIVVALALIAFTLMNNKQENQAKTDIVAQKNASVAVKVDTVKTETSSLNFTANGNFEPFKELDFSAEKPGRVVRVLVEEGDHVRVGQTLAIVRSEQVSAELHAAEAAYQNASTNFKRFENALKTGGVTEQQMDQAKLTLVTAQSRLEQAKVNAGDVNIKATIKGVVNKRYIEPGSVLGAATPMFEIVDVSKLKLRVTVNESQVTSLKVGDPVNVKASVLPDRTFLGKITFIAPKSDSSLNFPVEIEISNNPDSALKAGMYGTATFTSWDRESKMILLAPRNAFLGSVSSNQVFVAEDGVAKLTGVTAGRIFGDKVEILDGLDSNELVVVTGQINLQNGSKIDIID